MPESSLYNKQLIAEENFLISLIQSDDTSLLYQNNIKGLANALIDGSLALSTPANEFVFQPQGGGVLNPGTALRVNLNFNSSFPANWGAAYYPTQTGDLNNNGVTIDNSVFKYGAGSALFDGIDDYLFSGSGFNLSSGILSPANDFTFGVWVYLNSAPGTFTILGSGQDDTTNFGYKWDINASGMKFTYSNDGTTPIELDSDVLSWSTGTWYYLTIERDGNDFHFYRDGINVGTSVISGTLFFALNLSAPFIGVNPSLSSYFNGNMDDLTLRYKALYNGVNFTPPTGEITSSEFENVDVESTTKVIPDLTRVRIILMGDTAIQSDIELQVSLDNGATYGNIPISLRTETNYTIMSGSIDASTLTSTNQLKYRIISSNNINFNIYYVIISWDNTISTEEGITEPSASGAPTVEEIWEAPERTLTSAGLSMSVSSVSFMAKAIAQGFNLANVEIANGGYNYFQFVNEKGFWHQVRESVNLLETRYAAGQPTKITSANGWTNRVTIDYSETADI